MTDDEIREHLARDGLSPEDTFDLADHLVELLHKARMHHSCISCLYFIEKDEDPAKHEHCSRYGVRPPARVIAIGCPGWETE